jgi:single-strand DNA-binding protein
MRDLNRVTLMGRVGQDPEVRYTAGGDPIANLSLATSETWKDKQGQKQERTEWHRIACFGKLAEIVKDYVRKGDPLYLEGAMRTRKWQGNDGQDRYTTEVVLSGPHAVVSLLGGSAARGGGGGQKPVQDDRKGQERRSEAPTASQGHTQNGQEGFYSDDIPF